MKSSIRDTRVLVFHLGGHVYQREPAFVGHQERMMVVVMVMVVMMMIATMVFEILCQALC